MQKNPKIIRKNSNVYVNKIFRIEEYQLKLQNKIINRSIIKHNGSSAILALENNKVIMINQYRFPYGFILEIPAGTIENGETAKACALREIKEETGYKAKKIEFLIKYYPTIGYNTECIHCYLANNLEYVGTKLDHDELIEVKKIELHDLIKMIYKGKIMDSKTICSILFYLNLKKTNKSI